MLSRYHLPLLLKIRLLSTRRGENTGAIPVFFPDAYLGAGECLTSASALRAQHRGRRHLHSTLFPNPTILSPARISATRSATDQLAVAFVRGVYTDQLVACMTSRPWS